MPYWRMSKQIDVAMWRSHVKRSVEMLVPGEWIDTGDDDLHLRRIRLLGTADGKKSKFTVEVRQRLRSDIVTKPVDSPMPGYNTEYEVHEYPKAMDSATGHRNVSFSCEVIAYPETWGFGAHRVAKADDLDTPYEVAEFARSAIVGYHDGDAGPEDAPTPPPPVPSSVPEPDIISV